MEFSIHISSDTCVMVLTCIKWSIIGLSACFVSCKLVQGTRWLYIREEDRKKACARVNAKEHQRKTQTPN